MTYSWGLGDFLGVLGYGWGRVHERGFLGVNIRLRLARGAAAGRVPPCPRTQFVGK